MLSGGTDLENKQAPEVAYFDIYPQNDLPEFNGAWSNYPILDSGL